MRAPTALLALALSLAAASQARADADAIPEIHLDKPTGTSSSLDQLITFQVGELQAQDVHISNGAYDFDYSGAHSLYGEAGWAVRLLGGKAGAFYFETNLGFTNFSGNAAAGASGANSQPLDGSYSLYLFAADLRVMYAADWLPLRWLVPFAEGGYQGNYYFQPASSSDQSVEGTAGFPVAGAGLRLWLNPKSSFDVAGMPIFLSLKYNRIFPGPGTSSFQLAENSFLGGLTLGL